MHRTWRRHFEHPGAGVSTAETSKERACQQNAHRECQALMADGA
jgi:hypothetical protein